MPVTLLTLFDFIGTVAFAISGALVGIHKKMDIFGVNVLAVTTACGGGVMRDLIIGCTPPKMFQNPFFVLAAVVVANVVFLLCYLHRHMPKKLAKFYDAMLFWFDSLGLAAFTVDGVMAGVRAGYGENTFLICFLGCDGQPDAGYFPQAHLCRCRHCRCNSDGCTAALSGQRKCSNDRRFYFGADSAQAGRPFPLEPAQGQRGNINNGCAA